MCTLGLRILISCFVTKGGRCIVSKLRASVIILFGIHSLLHIAVLPLNIEDLTKQIIFSYAFETAIFNR